MEYNGKEKVELIKKLNKLRNQVMDYEKNELLRRKIEDALRESETQMRMILNSLGDAIQVLDKDLCLVMMNTSFQRWNLELGLDIDVIGKPILDVFPFLPETVLDEYKKVFNTGEKLITEEVTKIGEREFVTETRKIPIYEDGEVSQVITVIRDITQNKLSYEALIDSEERFRGIAEESFDIIFVIDLKGHLSYISPSVEKITGYSRDEVLGKSLEEFLPESELKRMKQASEKLLNSETIEGLELLIISKNKSTVCVEINATSVLRNGKVVGIQGIARDITDRKRAEEDMKTRLMKFRLSQGKVYLIEETSNAFSREVLGDLVKAGYTGLIISRTYDSHHGNKYNGNYEFLWLSENGTKNAIKPKLTKIAQTISRLPHKKVIHINRLDYLISKHGFKKVLHFIQNLSELAVFSNHIIIISIDPAILNQRELRLVEKETSEIEHTFKTKLPEDLNIIMRYVFEQNISGKKPTYSAIEHELGVCKPTMRKRIRRLISSGYLVDNKIGRSKILELTERGKGCFQV